MPLPRGSAFRPRNNLSADALSITATNAIQGTNAHETSPIDRICSLHFCARSDPVCFGNAERKPEYTYHQHRQRNHPSARLGPSRWSRSSLRMGPRPPLRLATSSPLVRGVAHEFHRDGCGTSELARFGPPAMSAVRSLSVGKRTWLGLPISGENDPKIDIGASR